jgi:quercetin dioxygenase-like cupin family protein
LIKGPVNKANIQKVKALDGIYRKTMAYNDSVMLCYFDLEKNAEIPLHDHDSHQIGYIVSGKIQFITETRGDFLAQEGDSYVFDSREKHGARVLETAEVIEVFCPTRDEYK